MSSLVHLLPGPFNFLRAEDQELADLTGDLRLPRPQRVFREDEVATPLHGFPVLVSPPLEALQKTLVAYVTQEEAAQVAIHRRQHHDKRAVSQAWEAYRALLRRAVGNVTMSSYGRQFPHLFWLLHSADVAALLKETPRRTLRLDADVGRQHGDGIKYRVYHRWLDRVRSATYDQVQEIAVEIDEVEEELFPPLLTRMADNVLIFTEDHVGRGLEELSAFFSGHLRLDGRSLRQRLEAHAAWLEETLAQDRELSQTVVHLLDADPRRSWELVTRPGMARFLASRAGYPREQLLSPDQVEVWESLLVKLKEFELFHGLRRMLLPVERSGPEGLLTVSRRGSLSRTLMGRDPLTLSSTTRPLDFMASWVVDPQVARFGMIYDIADFSQGISVLRRAGSDAQDQAFRQMFRFQRRINRLAAAQRLNMEKYLGDGAFYSSREARRMLVVAIQVQRLYKSALDEGFPFDQGLRIALNFGQYRLIPIDGGHGGHGGGGERYEFFGHGLVELSRLTTGKATREIEEIKTLLVNLGYREEIVHRFFAPLLTRNVDVVDKQEETRPFRAYINQNGNLINEGMVATRAFLTELDHESPGTLLRWVEHHGRRYVVLELEGSTPVVGSAPERMLVGLRSLGKASLKGLERLEVFEVVDLKGVDAASLPPLHESSLVAAVSRETGGPSGDGSGSAWKEGGSDHGTRPLTAGESKGDISQ